MIDNDAVILGLLLVILAVIFRTNDSPHPFFRRFYRFVPMLLLCYFLPSLLTLSGLVDIENSMLYFVATRYLLPASLVLLTLSIDLSEIVKLGPKAIIMFLTGTVGVVIGGPLALLIVGLVSPESVGGQDGEAIWRGLATVAGSWIGGGANQAAMKEIFEPSERLYSLMVAVDVVVAEVWMAILLLGVGKHRWIDARLKADSSSVDQLTEKMELFSKQSRRIPSSTDLFMVLGVAFGVTALCHLAADAIAPWIEQNYPTLNRFSLNSAFFWLIVLATTGGVLLSFTSARGLHGAGASQLGTVFIFMLVATIGLRMDVTAVAERPMAFVIGGLWMMIHVGLLLVVAVLIRAPYFFLAVGSKANIGGAASAPVVAAAFHPALAPVGVLLAVVGYALGTYAAYLCALMMEAISAA
ncbi:DUF819 family protein [Crateriforma conspicua]|uniref:DUF819 domain-containing protein n=1 Tax=Crateriforma conspicua TaxID=2527996 RepID=A0A5C5Y7S7_9PLAN|nr:DUF819 family protein [Crateriforma conspicua]QDV65629.1 hypothetical protein Mal65_48020 [Crateriforma conspicua]TWT71029.1 hypothetical protein Pan14r_33390 [Crateriforma conspicua]